jgi:hypothetical protein
MILFGGARSLLIIVITTIYTKLAAVEGKHRKSHLIWEVSGWLLLSPLEAPILEMMQFCCAINV